MPWAIIWSWCRLRKIRSALAPLCDVHWSLLDTEHIAPWRSASLFLVLIKYIIKLDIDGSKTSVFFIFKGLFSSLPYTRLHFVQIKVVLCQSSSPFICCMYGIGRPNGLSALEEITSARQSAGLSGNKKPLKNRLTTFWADHTNIIPFIYITKL